MIKAVFFDLDGTLLDRDTSVRQFVEAQYDRLIHCLGHISKADYVARFVALDCRGQVWKDRVYQALVEEFKLEGITWQLMLEDYETQFRFHCVPFAGLLEMLSELKHQGYLIGIVTNGLKAFQCRSIEGLSIQDYMDVVLVSDQENIRKPQAEIFQRAMDRLNVSASQSVFVGDNPKADIAGAKGANMRAIWKRNPYWPETREADAIIDCLDEIPHLLESFRRQ